MNRFDATLCPVTLDTRQRTGLIEYRYVLTNDRGQEVPAPASAVVSPLMLRWLKARPEGRTRAAAAGRLATQLAGIRGLWVSGCRGAPGRSARRLAVGCHGRPIPAPGCLRRWGGMN